MAITLSTGMIRIIMTKYAQGQVVAVIELMDGERSVAGDKLLALWTSRVLCEHKEISTDRLVHRCAVCGMELRP